MEDWSRRGGRGRWESQEPHSLGFWGEAEPPCMTFPGSILPSHPWYTGTATLALLALRFTLARKSEWGAQTPFHLHTPAPAEVIRGGQNEQQARYCKSNTT